MTQIWRKVAWVYPDRNLWWSQSHMMLPTACHLRDDIYRVYYSGRDEKNISHIGWVDIDVCKEEEVEHSRYPVLSPGDLGCFDDNGVTPSSVVHFSHGVYLYYIGWKPRSTTRMGLQAGLAKLDKDGYFKRVSRATILPPTDEEPYNIHTAPFVLLNAQGHWDMWYVGGEGWFNSDLPIYKIKHASSFDGVYWHHRGEVAVDFKDENEVALARPCVVLFGDRKRMWFSYKDTVEPYRIGYAESPRNGKVWDRHDEEVWVEPHAGHDDEMQCYPYVFWHDREWYMLHNGNNYGENGFALCKLESGI